MTTVEDQKIEVACEVMHDAYEQAALGAGWETQEASRKPWSLVPEANKVTMRAAVKALLRHFSTPMSHGTNVWTRKPMKLETYYDATLHRRWHLTAANGRIVGASSEAFTGQKEAIRNAVLTLGLHYRSDIVIPGIQDCYLALNQVCNYPKPGDLAIQAGQHYSRRRLTFAAFFNPALRTENS